MKTLHTILYILALLSLCNSCDHDNQHHEFQFMEFSDDTPQGRVLLSDSRKPIRIHPFFDLSWATDEIASAIKDHMVPAVISYFQTTLKVDPLPTNLVLTKSQLEDCDTTISPEIITNEGVPADFVVFIDGELTNNAVMANSRAYILHERTKRPLVGRFSYNRFKNWDSLDDYTYELHLITTLHEFVHMLGFSKNLYEYYYNPETGKHMQYVATKTKLNNHETLLLRLQPLSTRLRTYFNCSNLEGAYLENEGTSQNTASHFERRIFYNELMTAAAIDDRRISEFTLAVLEGSGWYTPDYSMAEPLFWGKGAGCSFINEKCIDENQKARFSDHFCDNRGQVGCTFTGQAKGVCGLPSVHLERKVSKAFDYFGDHIPVSDMFADNCPYYRTLDHITCDNPQNQDTSFIPGETFGKDSMCFSGTLSKSGELGFTMLYCMKKTCEEKSPGQFALGIEVEGSKYYCADGESITVNGYEGKLNCPNSINDFCSTKAFKYCKRGCMGRGVCQNGECVCDPGFEGPGCSRAIVPQKPKTNISETTSTNTHTQTEGSKTEVPKSSVATIESATGSEDNGRFVYWVAIVVGIATVFGVILLTRKIQCGQDDLDQTIEEAVNIKPEYAVVKTEDNQANVIEIDTQEEGNEKKESQPNQEDTGRMKSEDTGDEEKATKEAPSAAFGNQKAKYVEL